MAEYTEKEKVLEILRHNPAGTWRGTPVYSDEIKTAMREVKALKAADVVPAKRKACGWCSNLGQRPENWECSLVGEYGTITTADNDVVWTTANYCPVCGRPPKEADRENN